MTLNNDDKVLAETIVNAMFDGGFVSSVTLLDPDGQLLFQKVFHTAQQNIPSWLPAVVHMPPVKIEQELTDGWRILGTLTLEGQPMTLIGLHGPTPDRTVLWIPSLRTLVGGIPVVAGEHVWMADTQSPQSHTDWLTTLTTLAALKPAHVIPGHYARGAALDATALTFTADYIRAFDEETARSKNADALIAAMKKRYPTLQGVGSLEISAKVAKGEMQWP